MINRSVAWILFVVSIPQVVQGQQGESGYEKIVKTISFFGVTTDTTIVVKQYDSGGNLVEEPSEFEIFPIRIDTIRSLDGKVTTKYLWEDKSTTTTYEVRTKTNWTRIGLSRNGIDTTHFSSFSFNKGGLLTEGMVLNQVNTTIYKFRGKYTFDEIQKIRSNILDDIKLINLSGVVKFKKNKRILIIDLKDERNRIKIRLNRQLQPTKVSIYKFHDDHDFVFSNKIYYKYKAGEIVEIRSYDDHGDIEMIKEISYKWK